MSDPSFDQASQSATRQPVARATGEIPDTDDPVVLRELLRQAREQLALHKSVDKVISDNVARSEALLAEAARARDRAAVSDVSGIRNEIAGLRTSLEDALKTIDRLEAILPAGDSNVTRTAESESEQRATSTDSRAPGTDSTRTVEVVMHPVNAPALARSAQQHLLGIDGVTSAEVRELAEGLLRITVEGTIAITGDTFATWEPQRSRSVRTSNPDALEIELAD